MDAMLVLSRCERFKDAAQLALPRDAYDPVAYLLTDGTFGVWHPALYQPIEFPAGAGASADDFAALVEAVRPAARDEVQKTLAALKLDPAAYHDYPDMVRKTLRDGMEWLRAEPADDGA